MPRLPRLLGCCFCLGWSLAGPAGAARGSPLEGYLDYQKFANEVQQFRGLERAAVASLGTTLGGRELFLITVSRGTAQDKPAILVLGSVEPAQLLGSELALRMARRMATSDAWRPLLEKYTFYFVPRPSPDATETCLRPPYFERDRNERPTDDDRDGQTNEDGVDDLNGDGWITMLRVEDATGDHLPHPADARVMIVADPAKNEQGQYRLYSEGIDNDQDDAWNEDGPGGVAFNHNFTFQYPYFQPGAGPHQVSEIETRAVADFAFAHPNIAAVFCFSTEDNLLHAWKPDASAEAAKIKTAVLKADAPYFEFLAKQYQELHGGKDPPPATAGAGSFSEWAYFHFGRWSLAARAWWPPKVAVEPSAPPASDKSTTPSDSTTSPNDTATSPSASPVRPPEGIAASADAGAPVSRTAPAWPADDQRGALDVQALRWFAQSGIDGFVAWQPIVHPDFPGKHVEVGGFKPFLRLNPPAAELDALAEKHEKFLQRLVELLPTLQIEETKVEPLGEGLFRVSLTIANHGYLPTASAMGKLTEEVCEPQAAIDLPASMELVTGHVRHSIEQPLAGRGGKATITWLVRRQADERSVTLRTWCPSVGADQRTVDLAP